MTKTPEDMDKVELLAASYACDYRDSPSKTNGVPDSYLVYSIAYDGFLAGYQAGYESLREEIQALTSQLRQANGMVMKLEAER